MAMMPCRWQKRSTMKIVSLIQEYIRLLYRERLL